jgi:putative FmdB family regulatory protein
MPIYEYRCAACQHKLEALQKFSDAPLTTCPECGQAQLRKLVSAAGFQLKGSGWYQTDFRGSGGQKKSEKSDEAAPAADGAAKPDAPAKTESSTSEAAKPASPAPATSSSSSA